MVELDVKPLSNFLVLDVKKLTSEDINRLARLFDRLEEEARRLGGIDTAENMLGSELAKELTDREVRPEVKGIFNTVIKEIDYEIAKILGIEYLVETVRSMVIEMARRRLLRAGEVKEVLKGTENIRLRRTSTRKGSKRSFPSKRLDEYF